MTNFKSFILLAIVVIVIFAGVIFYINQYQSIFTKDKMIFNTILSTIAENKTEVITDIDMTPVELLSEEVEVSVATSSVEMME